MFQSYRARSASRSAPVLSPRTCDAGVGPQPPLFPQQAPNALVIHGPALALQSTTAFKCRSGKLWVHLRSGNGSPYYGLTMLGASRFGTGPVLRGRIVLASVLTFAAAALAVLTGRESSERHPVRWQIRTSTTAYRDRAFMIQVEGRVRTGVQVYAKVSMPNGPIGIILRVLDSAAFKMEQLPILNSPHAHWDPTYQAEVATYADLIVIPAQITPRISGRSILHIEVRYQACTDRYCLPPVRDTITSTVLIRP